MGRSSRCTDQSENYKSPHSTCEMRLLGECYAVSAVEEGCNSPTHQSSDGSSSYRKVKGKIPYGEKRENPVSNHVGPQHADQRRTLLLTFEGMAKRQTSHVAHINCCDFALRTDKREENKKVYSLQTNTTRKKNKQGRKIQHERLLREGALPLRVYT
ncbi:hypothetical protein SK128_028150 [Halocaridina rubra]|uniref:Uncharacterized protein n=1 Tax=Halocaridina rubra TaxID=373956 RepID=A0AAN8WLV3_HALRR